MKTDFCWFTVFVLLFLLHIPLYAQEVRAKPSQQQLLDPNWIEQQLGDMGVDQLVTMYEGHQQAEVKLVGSALDLSRHILRKYPEALRSQLQARLVSHQNPLLRPFQKLPKEQIQIFATTPVLTQAGGYVLRTLSGHQRELVDAKFLSDGKRIISTSDSGAIKIWDINSGKVIRTIESVVQIAKMKLTPDNKTLITISNDKLLKMWDIKSGQLLCQIPVVQKDINKLEISPDGKILLSHSWEKISRWDVQTKTQLPIAFDYTKYICCQEITPDGKRVVTADMNHYLIWDLKTGQRIKAIPSLKHKDHYPCNMAITLNGQFAIFDMQHSLEILNLKSGFLRFYHQEVPRIPFKLLTFRIEQQRLIAKYADDIRYIWDLTSGKIVVSKPISQTIINAQAISIKQNKILFRESGNVLQLCDLKKFKQSELFKKKPERLYSISISTDGKQVATGGNGKLLKIYDFQSLKVNQTLKAYEGQFNIVKFSRDGKRLFSGARGGNTPSMWDLQTGKVLKKFHDPSGYSGSCHFAEASDGKKVFTGAYQRGIIEWNLRSKTKNRLAGIESKRAYFMLLTPDGKQLVSGHYDRKVRIHDCQTLKLLTTLECGPHEIYSIAISSDGKQLMAGGGNGTMRIWSSWMNEAKIVRLYYWHVGEVNFLAFLPKDQLIVSGSSSDTHSQIGGDSLRITNPKSNQLLSTFYFDTKFLCGAVSSDGKTVLVGTTSGKLHKLRIENLPD